ncbi:hypothetical protein P170DRAFT_393160 [Aspergillus steynii IBT 23096]|uniref:Asteroid domain-containing protein n=1 Tax=Aspergillus steynii IBT 23096 TaxID=1392250 RepID=A0A2I2FVN3_9EURO|nr:uncharacterized protein P170DRAFT_393160 [Aspergillus steynii IBT 23096]PLB44674.1 hypothetical protein P170DRAFT_393160 [Aspergillus steynii IBT 23096]
MGIPRLTQHLLSFSDTALLGRKANTRQQESENIESIVIDGPSLVYHVYGRLLSWSDPKLNFPDLQPTCNEVSCGVMICLLQLTIIGVRIEEICFDGALPLQKRETRLTRLEKSRTKLEQFCLKTRKGFLCSNAPRNDRAVNPEMVLGTQSLSARHNTLPESPFIVPAVFEDLKHRWSRENILNVAKDTMCIPQIHLADLPWADITVMVSGEADAHCARKARCSNSAILTNDSDLLLYNLGPCGSVVLLNSLHISNWDPTTPAASQVKCLKICPTLVAQRLGIRDLMGLAYGLQNQPHVRLAELIQQTNQTQGQLAELPAFRIFLEEYRAEANVGASHTAPWNLDARVSELFWQYELRHAFAPCQPPHMYLAVLTEDHSRRCAWATGLPFRSLAYSILNSSRPASERHPFINEFARRGGRIAAHQIYLGDAEWIVSQIDQTWARTESIGAALGVSTSFPVYWLLFALYEVYDTEGGQKLPGPEQLSRFLILGHMGKELEWTDIHLNAQIQAVLYSLRILSQVLQITTFDSGVAPQLRNLLARLPAIHLMMRPASQIMTTCIPSRKSITNLVEKILRLVRGMTCPQSSQFLTEPPATPTKSHKDCRTPRNLYDLLECE